jgi:hypothetical protein
MIGLLACSESVGPSSHPGPGVSAAKAASVIATGVTASGGAAMVTFAASAPRLATYDTSFVVMVGKELKASVLFADGKTQFLCLIIPRDAEFFDAAGNPLPKNDTVRVTLRIDSVFASVQFGPQGSLFLGTKGPALMSINYGFLGFGARAPTDLRLWYQPDSGGVWAALATQIDITNKWLYALIYHFSNYAIAY